jgi:hypothetical protein
VRTNHLVILAACGSLFALPAFAQNHHHNGNSAMQGQNPSESSAMQSQDHNGNQAMQWQDHNGSSAMQGQNQAMQSGKNPRQMLTQELKQAGFTRIRIEPETFVVHAINRQGEPVLMQISPDSVEAVTAMKEPNRQEAQNNANENNANGSGSSDGNKNTTQQ